MDIPHNPLRRHVGAWLTATVVLASIGMSSATAHRTHAPRIDRAPVHVTLTRARIQQLEVLVLEPTIDTGELPDPHVVSLRDAGSARVERVTASRVMRRRKPPLVSGRHQHLRI
jgi:hypothetical protein